MAKMLAIPRASELIIHSNLLFRRILGLIYAYLLGIANEKASCKRLHIAIEKGWKRPSRMVREFSHWKFGGSFQLVALVITRGYDTIKSHQTTISLWFSYGFLSAMEPQRVSFSLFISSQFLTAELVDSHEIGLSMYIYIYIYVHIIYQVIYIYMFFWYLYIYMIYMDLFI